MFQTNRLIPFACALILLISACTPTQPVIQPTEPNQPTEPVPTTVPPTTTSSPQRTDTPPTPAASIFDVVIDNLAIGQQGEFYASGFGKDNDLRHFARWDGTTWTELKGGFATVGNTLAVDKAGYLYTDVLVDAAQGQATAIMRWDGHGWEDITGNFSLVVDALKAGRVSSNFPVIALAVDGDDNLYAAGTYYYLPAGQPTEMPMGYVAKWNRQTWTVLGQGLDLINIFGLAVGPAGQVYVSGEQPPTPAGNSSYIAQWDGKIWTQLATSGQTTIKGLALDQAGRLYAYDQSNVIADWDGANWTTIANELSGEAPAVYDMTVDGGGHLCIGGSFDAIEAIPTRNLACWDGKGWSALGNGLNERVNALVFSPRGNLYAVGFFTEAENLPAPHAAYWDGEKWYPIGYPPAP
jgi:hypothetical protein